MSDRIDVAIIGAGPYGISIAAHLSRHDIDYRLFGTPMHTWRNHMPEGMWLRSEGFASNLVDPDGELTLEAYCAEHRFDVGGWGVPVPLEVYSGYGEWFVEQTKVPVEDTQVVSLSRDAAGFALDLATGETVRAGKVVVAVGLTHFQFVPVELTSLPPELCSHSSSVRGGISGTSGSQLHPAEFAGKRVLVIGAGQSALENAALLHEHGALVEIAARAGSIVWNPHPHSLDRPVAQRLRRPVGGLCTGMGCWLYEHGPRLFHLLPERSRLRLASTTFGPSGAWWLRDRIEGKVPMRLGHQVRGARPIGEEAEVELESPTGRTSVRADHVISATGYRVDLGRLSFLDGALANSILTVDNYPVLDARLQSTVPGLHFVGAASALAFGPVVRFVLGADFTSRVLERHLVSGARSNRRRANERLAS